MVNTEVAHRVGGPWTRRQQDPHYQQANYRQPGDQFLSVHLDLLQGCSRAGPTLKLGKHTLRHPRLDEVKMWIEREGLMEVIPRLLPLP